MIAATVSGPGAMANGCSSVTCFPVYDAMRRHWPVPRPETRQTPAPFQSSFLLPQAVQFGSRGRVRVAPSTLAIGPRKAPVGPSVVIASRSRPQKSRRGLRAKYMFREEVEPSRQLGPPPLDIRSPPRTILSSKISPSEPPMRYQPQRPLVKVLRVTSPPRTRLRKSERPLPDRKSVV